MQDFTTMTLVIGHIGFDENVVFLEIWLLPQTKLVHNADLDRNCKNWAVCNIS